MKKIFVTGTGTGIGKTVVSAILAEALGADYWKPIQAGYEQGTDSEWVRSVVSDAGHEIFPELYLLKLAASPHIAAREENVHIDLGNIAAHIPDNSRNLIIEGAGGLLVPLNDDQFVIDLIKKLNVDVVLISRNTLGSINHSLLTAMVCKHNKIPVLGWIFNDNYLDYEDEIVKWSGFPKIASIPYSNTPDRNFIVKQANGIREQLSSLLCLK
ncbi:MAG: dethiobiotin synthase [Flavitalea sp.]